jgi:CBS domain-containing protein
MTQPPETKPGAGAAATVSHAEAGPTAQAGASRGWGTERCIRAAMAAAPSQGGATAHDAMGEAGGTLRRSSMVSATRMAMAVAEAAQRSAGALALGHLALLGQATERCEAIGRGMAQAAQDTASALLSLMAPPAAATQRLWDLQVDMTGLANDVMRSNASVVQELLRMDGRRAAHDWQRRLIGGCLDTMAQGPSAFINIAHQTAGQARSDDEQEQNQRDEGHRVVADIMSAHIRLVAPDDTVQQATRLMRDEGTGILAVGEGGRLIGVVTDRDVALRLVAEGRDPVGAKVRDVMTQEARYVFDDEALGPVAQRMVQQQVRRLPVVNRAKRVVGVVSLADLAGGGRSGRDARRAMPAAAE